MRNELRSELPSSDPLRWLRGDRAHSAPLVQLFPCDCHEAFELPIGLRCTSCEEGRTDVQDFAHTDVIASSII